MTGGRIPPENELFFSINASQLCTRRRAWSLFLPPFIDIHLDSLYPSICSYQTTFSLLPFLSLHLHYQYSSMLLTSFSPLPFHLHSLSFYRFVSISSLLRQSLLFTSDFEVWYENNAAIFPPVCVCPINSPPKTTTFIFHPAAPLPLTSSCRHYTLFPFHLAISICTLFPLPIL
jgi:hypothetical protein